MNNSQYEPVGARSPESGVDNANSDSAGAVSDATPQDSSAENTLSDLLIDIDEDEVDTGAEVEAKLAVAPTDALTEENVQKAFRAAAEAMRGNEAIGDDHSTSSSVAVIAEKPDVSTGITLIEAPAQADSVEASTRAVPDSKAPEQNSQAKAAEGALKNGTRQRAAGTHAGHLDWHPNVDRRTGWLVARRRRGGAVFHHDSGDIGSETFRRRFLKRCRKKCPAIDLKSLRKKMQKIWLGVLKEEEEDEVRGPADEVADAISVRPELAIVRKMTSITVSALWRCGNDAYPEHLMYISQPGGRRECRKQETFMDLGDDVKVLHSSESGKEPDPADDTWRLESRLKWLKSGETPAPGRLYTRILSQWERHVYLPEDRRGEVLPLLSIWAMLTYGYPAWPAVPYLHLKGPWGSGKSLILDVLRRLVFRPLSSSNVTAPGVFHCLHHRGGTLLLDEAEQLHSGSESSAALRSILLAGNQRGAQVRRVADRYYVYGPKAIACILGVRDALLSRCIPIEMTRAPKNAEQIRRRVASDAETWMGIRDGLYAMALGHGADFLDLAELPVGDWLTGRQHDVWQPILSIASWLENCGISGLRATMESLAKRLIEKQASERSLSEDEVLVRTAADFARQKVTVTAGEILEAARKQAPTLLSTYSAKGAGTCLRKYGLKTTKSGGIMIYRPVPRAVFSRIQEAYSLDLGLDVPTPPAAEDDLGEELVAV